MTANAGIGSASAGSDRRGAWPLGPSAYGHRSLSEELLGLTEQRQSQGSKMPRPGVGTRAATDPRVVTSPITFTSPRTLTTPRTYLDPRATTTIRALDRR